MKGSAVGLETVRQKPLPRAQSFISSVTVLQLGGWAERLRVGIDRFSVAFGKLRNRDMPVFGRV